MITDLTNIKKENHTLLIVLIAILLTIGIFIIIKLTSKNDIITIDETNICNNNIYDGFPKTLSKLETNNQYTVTNNEATNAGEYKVIIEPNKGYAWENNSKKAKEITCTIEKAKTSLTTNKDSINITKNNKDTLSINTNIEGKLTLTYDNTIINIKEGKEINKNKEEITINITGIKEGKTNLEIQITPTNTNYENISKVVEININDYKKIAIPTTSICNKITYNGQSQKLVSKTDYEGYTLKGEIEAKEVGYHKIEAVLKQGYIWNDGNTSNKEILCYIEKETQYSIKLQNSSCIAGETTYLTIESKYFRPNWNEDGVKSIKNNTQITSATPNTSCACTTFKGYNNNNNSQICANCVYPGRYEIKCLSPGTDTITFTMDNGEVLSTKITVNKGDTIKLGTEKAPYDGISCTKDKEITIRVRTYRDGVASSVLKKYSVKDTTIAKVSKASTQPSCIGCTNLVIKCLKKGSTNLTITTTDGTSKDFPIKYNS